jgi:pimeloyl-ACP methyl ester carboxylesterase
MTLARVAPWALRVVFTVLRRQLRDPARAERFVRKAQAAAPSADRTILAGQPERARAAVAATVDALAPGTRGAVQELATFGRPWGFALADIAAPVELWHGEADVSVPVAIAADVAAELPSCSANVIPGHGHSVGAVVADDVFTYLAGAGTAKR